MVRQTTSADQDHDDLRWNDGRKRGFAPSPECNALSSVYAICSQDGHTPREGQTDLFEGNPADERKCTHRQPCDECIGTQNSDLVIRQCQASEDNGWSLLAQFGTGDKHRRWPPNGTASRRRLRRQCPSPCRVDTRFIGTPVRWLEDRL